MKNILKKVLSVAAATALLMTSVVSAAAAHSHDGGTSLGGESSGDSTEKDNTYKITLTLPEGKITKPDEIHLGAYQIFSGSVPAKDDESYPGDDDYENPGTSSTPLPLTDIKWGNAFGDVGDADWQNNIVSFVKALAAAPDGDYSYAFGMLKEFKPFVGTDGQLIDKYFNDPSDKANSNVNFDKLALDVADVLTKQTDHEWLQAFNDILAGFAKGSGSYLNDGFVEQYYEGTVTGSSDTDWAYTIYVPAGYYMIKDLSGIEDTTLDAAYSARMLLVASDVTQHIKASVPTIDKNIVRDGTNHTTEAAGVGDTVTFKLTGTLPSNYENYIGGYQYTFVDTLSDGLEFVGSTVSPDVTITVKGYVYDKTNDKYVSAESLDLVIDTSSFDEDVHVDPHIKNGGKAYDLTYDGNVMTLKFPCLKEIVIEKDDTDYFLGYDTENNRGSEIVVEYSVKVTAEAKIGTDGNKNGAKIEYSNNPQAYGDTDSTTTKEATVYTFGLDISKVDSAAFIKGEDYTLDGAKFVILRANTDEGTKDDYPYQIATFKTVAKTEPIDTTAPFAGNGYYTITAWENITGSDLAGIKKEVLDTATKDVKTNYEDSVVISGNNKVKGDILISGLDDGIQYTVMEVVTPDNSQYAFIDPFTVTLVAAKVADEYNGLINDTTPDGTTVSNVVGEGKQFSFENYIIRGAADADGSEELTVANFKYTDLPSTGGIGVYIYYIAGGCVVALALVLFALSKKKKTTK